ncbi:MAG: glycosyltransferase family 4 protein [Beijerinckiaceae bacterium]
MRPILFDVTHAIARQSVQTPTGIDRVDHSYAVEFARGDGLAAGVQCFFSRPRLHAPAAVRAFAGRMSARWRENDDDLAADSAFLRFRRFLLGEPAAEAPRADVRIDEGLRDRTARYIGIARDMLAHDRSLAAPEGALFLSVAQNPTLIPRSDAFLRSRQDLKPVFLLHDLIAIDHPEFFAPGRRTDFERVLDVMFRHGAGVIVSTSDMADRLAAEHVRRGLAKTPIHVQPLPLPPGFAEPVALDRSLADSRYVVTVGTIEPRKNHWLLLHLWREMIRAGDDPPRLVVVGARGWENESLFRMLETTPEFAGRVLHLRDLGNAGLRSVVAHARALLMPSFVEGYGMPVTEALALGTPVIASAGTVFDEVSQGLATLIDPTDGPSWREAILAAAARPRAPDAQRTLPFPGFRPPLEAEYFCGVRSFLAEI